MDGVHVKRVCLCRRFLVFIADDPCDGWKDFGGKFFDCYHGWFD